MKDREELLLTIIHLLSEKFKDSMLLKGGMLLRLLTSYRSTQDVDFVLISKESKKILAAQIEKAMSKLDEVHITKVALNSRGIFMNLQQKADPSIKAVLEINVVPSVHLPPEHISTAKLSNQYYLGGRIVATQALPEAFANKVAAALERETLRDLYDISVFEGLCEFDITTLKGRLNKLSIRRKKPIKVSFQKAAFMLKAKANAINEEAIDRELSPLLPPNQSKGMSLIVKSAVFRTAEKIRICEEDFKTT